MDWCWSWNSNTLATWWEELTHWKRPWCWETLKVGGEGDDRGWDGWMASLTQWTWVWVNSGSWWWTGRPGVLQSMGSQTVRHDWAIELNWLNQRRTSLWKWLFVIPSNPHPWHDAPHGLTVKSTNDTSNIKAFSSFSSQDWFAIGTAYHFMYKVYWNPLKDKIWSF